MDSSILTPVLALVCWTLLIWAWMYALRIPAMQAANIDPQDAAHPGSLGVLPSKVRAVADNYNHLHEQPTIFYALAFYTYLAGHSGTCAVAAAWVYVGLRVLHSLVQNTSNKVMLRFGIFSLASLALMVLAGCNVLALMA